MNTQPLTQPTVQAASEALAKGSYFRFEIGPSGKIVRLDIGRAT